MCLTSSADPGLGCPGAPLDAALTREQVRAVVWRALDLDPSSAALARQVQRRDWVLLKPNIVTSPTHDCSYWYGGVAHPGQVTDTRVIHALVRYLVERCCPARISIAEGGAEWRRSSDPAKEDGWTVHWPEFGGLSYADIVAEFARSHPGLVDIVDLNEDEIRFGPVPDPYGSGIGACQFVGEEARPEAEYGRGAFVPGTGQPRQGYYMPRAVLECDRLISVPAMKTHTCGTTLALKNYVGVLPSHPSGKVNKGEVHNGDFQKGFIDLFAYHPADYCVIEGFWGTEGNGPQWGDNIQHNVVVAGADPVAADAVASAVMGFNPQDLDYLHYAVAKGFGVLDLDHTVLVGQPLAALRRRFATAAGRKGIPFVARGCRAWQLQAAGDTWVYRSGERYIDLARAMAGRGGDSVTAITDVRSRRTQRGWLWASANGSLRVWLNGQVVVAAPPGAGHSLGQHQVEVTLAEGVNRLQVAVTAAASGMGFTALLCDEVGYGMTDIEYQVPGNQETDA